MSNTNYVEGVYTGPGDKKRVMLATPTYSGKLGVDFVHSVLDSIPVLRDKQIGVELYFLSQNCHVDDARNHILRDFMLSTCDELVFIDADVSWHKEDLLKLICYDRDVVAGVYPKRSYHDTEFPVMAEAGVDLRADDDGLVEVIGAPTGFMKIKRHVLETMFEVNKKRRFHGQRAKSDDEKYTLVFERTLLQERRWSGDLNFCRQWRSLGGKVFVDPEMSLSHSGEVTFEGKLGDFWRKKHGVDHLIAQRKFDIAIEQLKLGNCAPEYLNDLSNGWGNPYAANVELLVACFDTAKECEGDILETGSGLSTLVMAIANPKIKIHCLEHDPVWASRVKYLAEIYNIENIVMHFGELKKYGTGKWYDDRELPQGEFNLALCDGPPRAISNRSLLYEKMGDQLSKAVVLMDDADDDMAVYPLKNWANGLNREVKVLGRKRRFAVCLP